MNRVNDETPPGSTPPGDVFARLAAQADSVLLELAEVIQVMSEMLREGTSDDNPA